MTVYEEILELWGADAQIGMAIEECAELIVALRKFYRPRTDKTIDNIVEEIADVELMMTQMRLLFGSDLVDAKKEEKLKRIKERIKDYKKEKI